MFDMLQLIRKTRSRLAFLPALLAVLVLAVLPPGVMPQVSTSGGIDMVLCSEFGPVQMVLDPVTGEVHEKSPDQPSKPGCKWASAVQVATWPDLPIDLPPLLTFMRRAQPLLANSFWRPAHDPRGIYARGPPSLI